MKGKPVDEDKLAILIEQREKTTAADEIEDAVLEPTMHRGYNENMTINEIKVKPSTYDITNNSKQ